MPTSIWKIKSPGILYFTSTSLEIHRVKRDGLQIYQIRHNGKDLAARWTFHLESAMDEAEKIMQELLAIGVEP